ncbi:hypothetical protein CEK25_004153 [Fusarium fujikuroi]|nr:hypothetical protein CEK25_004153 [Fusarium fujikuroi]
MAMLHRRRPCGTETHPWFINSDRLQCFDLVQRLITLFIGTIGCITSDLAEPVMRHSSTQTIERVDPTWRAIAMRHSESELNVFDPTGRKFSSHALGGLNVFKLPIRFMKGSTNKHGRPGQTHRTFMNKTHPQPKVTRLPFFRNTEGAKAHLTASYVVGETLLTYFDQGLTRSVSSVLQDPRHYLLAEYDGTHYLLADDTNLETTGSVVIDTNLETHRCCC